MTEPRYWIGTSWKMNKTLSEAERFATALAAADAGHDPRIQRFVIPPFTTVREVARILDGASPRVGAQNMHWADDGAWTGEISAKMLIGWGPSRTSPAGCPARRTSPRCRDFPTQTQNQFV